MKKEYKIIFYAYGPCELRPDLFIRSIFGHTYIGWYVNDKLVKSKGFYANGEYKKIPTGEGVLVDDSNLIEYEIYLQKYERKITKEEFIKTLNVKPHYRYNYLNSNCAKYAHEVACSIGLKTPNGLNKLNEIVPFIFIKYLQKNN